ncbi:MAG: long-chain fatty acid--CoA ligase, partial [Deltaproteobacteria bacterium]|nr:long-chain fatty acid--CoA ligase [Deltaproteobacteria bacterium]
MEFSEKTIAGIFHNRTETYQFEPFVRYKKEGKFKNLSWKELQHNVINLGLGLISLGVKPGEIVAIFSENCWQWIASDLAVLSIGAADAPIYATNSGEEAAYIINDSGAKIVFVSDQEHLDRVLSVKSKIKGVKKIIAFESVNTTDKRVLQLGEAMGLGENYKDQDAWTERLDALAPDDLATLIYTSGTTGPPKGVMLTHKNIVSNVFQCAATHTLSHEQESLNILPWSHSFGRTVGLYLMMHIGCIISLAESFATVMENLQELQPNLMVSVPRLFEKIYAGVFAQVEKSSPVKQKMFYWSRDVAQRAVDYIVERKEMPLTLRLQYSIAEKLVFSKLRTALGLNKIHVFINGGGPLSVEIDRYFNGIGVPLHNGYGLTETTPVTHTNTFETHVFGSVGPAVPGTEVKMADDGEVLIKGPQVMKGYFNLPQETKATFTDDGWFMTGDIGRVDEKGCLHITDRKKDIIITAGGKNIAPQNIENTLTAELLIEQAVVIGEGRKYLSALIVPNFAELSTYAKEHGISFDSHEA